MPGPGRVVWKWKWKGVPLLFEEKQRLPCYLSLGVYTHKKVWMIKICLNIFILETIGFQLVMVKPLLIKTFDFPKYP
jgi:hypothetical protein